MPGCTCELLSLISSQQQEPRRSEIIPYRGHKHCFQSILPAARQRAGYLLIIPSPRPARGFNAIPSQIPSAFMRHEDVSGDVLRA